MKKNTQAGPAGEPRAKRRGGQPGNSNARKHGCYSALFKENERRLLQHVAVIDLAAEIELIRVTNTRFLQALAASKDPLDFDANLTALRAVNLSAQSIAALLRVQAFTADTNVDAAGALNEFGILAVDEAESASPRGDPANDD